MHTGDLNDIAHPKYGTGLPLRGRRFNDPPLRVCSGPRFHGQLELSVAYRRIVSHGVPGALFHEQCLLRPTLARGISIDRRQGVWQSGNDTNHCTTSTGPGSDWVWPDGWAGLPTSDVLITGSGLEGLQDSRTAAIVNHSD